MFKIISDGGCDFSKEEAVKHDVEVVPFYINFDGDYLKEGIDINAEDFFKRLVAEKNIFPTTSQPNPQDYIDVCTPHLEAGKDVAVLTVSSKLSGSYNSAAVAADILGEDFPDRTIVVIDSLNASVAQDIILRELIKMRDNEYSLLDAQRLTKEVIKTTKVYFTLDSLEYLKRGGRIGQATALVGGLLGLRPILHLVDGEVAQLDSVRGRKNILKLIEEAMVDALKEEKQNVSISIGHTLLPKDAMTFKNNIESALGISMTNPIVEVGATIGAHTGPSALAFAYCKRYDVLSEVSSNE